MSWSFETVRQWLASYYPEAEVWDATISEAEHDVQLNLYKGCQNLDGFAIDKNADLKADLFLYPYDIYAWNAVSSRNLEDYIRPAQSLEEIETSASTCQQVAPDLESVAFPFGGNLLPDSYGRISEIMITASRETDYLVYQLMQTLSKSYFHILTYPKRFYPSSMLPSEKKMTDYFGRYLPVSTGRYLKQQQEKPDGLDFSLSESDIGRGVLQQDSPERWLQDQLFVAVNEHGERVVLVDSQSKLEAYGRPIDAREKVQLILTGSPGDGGDYLSSLRHLFIPNNWDSRTTSPLFLNQVARDKEIVWIESEEVKSAAHLDMILTPSEVIRDGKPVVFVAQVSLGNLDQLTEAMTRESKALDEIAKDLSNDFFVERIPYVMTSQITKHFETKPIAYSYNNILMEDYNDENGNPIRRVYIPQYDGYERENAMTIQAYQAHGYQVVPVKKMNQLADSGGSIRCLVKVVNREIG